MNPSAGVDFLYSVFAKIEYVLGKIEDGFVLVGLIGLFVMMILVAMNAVMRYLFSSPVPGTVEITELYLMPMAIVFVAASLQRREGNVNVDLLKRKFPDRAQTLVDILARSVTLLIFLQITISAGGRAWEAYERGFRTIGVIEFPVYFSWLIVTIGFFTFCIRLVLQLRSDTPEAAGWF